MSCNDDRNKLLYRSSGVAVVPSSVSLYPLVRRTHHLFRGEEKDKQSESKSYFRNLSRISFFFFNGTRNDRFYDFARILSLSLSLRKKAKKSTPMKAYCEKCINVIRESRWKEKRGERLCRKIGNIEGEGG